MPVLAPITRSPGEIRLVYLVAAVIHRTSLNVTAGTTLNYAVLGPDIDQFADKVAALLPSSGARVMGWEIANADGVLLSQGSYGSGIVGTHGTDPGMPALKSTTLAFPGRGRPPVGSDGSGRTIFRVFTSNSYAIPPGSKILTTLDTALLDITAWISGNSQMYADFYGQSAEWSGTVPVQINAASQRRNGT